MSYSFRKSDPSLTDGLRRIARSQIEAAIAEIDDAALDNVRTVHQVRKRCKKLRGLVRLVRPGFKPYAEENAAFRDLARTLSDLRDAGAMQETVTALEERFGSAVEKDFFDGLREIFAEASPPPDDDAFRKKLKAARKALVEALARVDGWEVKGKAADVVAEGAKLTYRRAVETRKIAAELRTPDAFHEYRKRVKYHWHQMRLLKRTWPKLIHARIDAARDLADDLGDHHDFALFRLDVLPGLERADADISARLAHMMEAEENRLEKRCLKHGARLFTDKPGHFGKRVAAYWEAWAD